MFDPVVVACDQGSLDVGLAIRAALELFRLRVHFYLCIQEQHVADVLAGHIPDSDYVVLCSHGTNVPHGPVQMSFGVVGQVDGRWDRVEVVHTPESIVGAVHLGGRTVISLGCETGRQPLAQAFLEAGCRAYVGPEKPVDQDAVALFTIAFFYHLLRGEREPGLAWTDREAVALAARADDDSREGTWVFRYHGDE